MFRILSDPSLVSAFRGEANLNEDSLSNVEISNRGPMYDKEESYEYYSSQKLSSNQLENPQQTASTSTKVYKQQSMNFSNQNYLPDVNLHDTSTNDFITSSTRSTYLAPSFDYNNNDYGAVFTIKREPKLKYLIGKVDHAIRWFKQLKKFEGIIIYHIMGILENIISKTKDQLIFLKGDSGHILQCVFYNIDRNLPNFKSGTILRVTGKMIGGNKMVIFDAEQSSSQEMEEAIPRIAYLSQRTVDEMLGK